MGVLSLSRWAGAAVAVFRAVSASLPSTSVT